MHSCRPAACTGASCCAAAPKQARLAPAWPRMPIAVAHGKPNILLDRLAFLFERLTQRCSPACCAQNQALMRTHLDPSEQLRCGWCHTGGSGPGCWYHLRMQCSPFFFLFLLFSSLLISYRPEGLGTLLLRLCSLLQRQGCLAAEPGLRLSILQWRGRPSLQAIENPAQLGMLG